MPKIKYQRVTGMKDILPVDFVYYDKILSTIKQICDFYSFNRIETPILERIELFERGIGVSSDIVEKQMFSLKTRDEKDTLVLRPEGTAGVARAYFENGLQELPHPLKLWYFGPFFRYERPQKGRYRQFYQFGIEIIGEENYILDVYVMHIFKILLEELGIKNLVFEVNSIGNGNCRPYYKKSLLSYLRKNQNKLCSTCRKRLKVNPFRILDCKEEKCKRVCSQAPQIVDFLCDECKNHFKKVVEVLDTLQFPYTINPFLARGLDYYNRTVFEIIPVSFEEYQKDKDNFTKKDSIGGGGRYDDLLYLIGREEIPAVGGALGIERIIDVLKDNKVEIKEEYKPDIFFVQIGDLPKKKSFAILEELRKHKINCAESIGKDSLKGQLRIADKLGVKYVIIYGQKEAFENVVVLRDMKTGSQTIVSLQDLVKEIKARLKNK
ncbi:Histidine--tRNA ligase [bacterium HR34]|nr:Histidine--tRNA ligase [bacterium HR34]